MKNILLSLMLLSTTLLLQANQAGENPISKKEQASLTPDEVINMLKAGNTRYVQNNLTNINVDTRIKASSLTGQYPKAVILSCLDSRVLVEKIFDVSIGDIFVGRVAGNVESTDQLGSMEYATKLAGAKLVVVLGHNECGAVNGAIDNVKLGNLTSLLAKIQPAIDATSGFSPQNRNTKNTIFVNKVIKQNVIDTLASIRQKSPVLKKLEDDGVIKIIGALYDIHTGKVEFLHKK